MIHHSSRGEFAIRDKQWKLVMGSTKKRKQELYDLSNDPGETHNLFDTQRERAGTLQQKLTRIVRSGRSTQGNPVPNDTPYWDDLFWMTELSISNQIKPYKALKRKQRFIVLPAPVDPSLMLSHTSIAYQKCLTKMNPRRTFQAEYLVAWRTRKAEFY
jgi:hypothetical protein